MALRKSLFYSFFIHLGLVLLLVYATHRPDHRPVRVVDHWVVDLVTAANAGPKEAKEPLLKNRIFEKKRNPTPIIQRLKDPPEEILPPSADLDSPSPEKETALRLDEIGQNIGEYSTRQTQMGQYRLVMKLNNQVSAAGLKRFYLSTHEHLEKLLLTSLPEEVRNGAPPKVALVEISYQEDGGVGQVLVNSESDREFDGLLKEKIPWHSLTPPVKFGLPNKTVKLQIRIEDQGKIILNVALL